MTFWHIWLHGSNQPISFLSLFYAQVLVNNFFPHFLYVQPNLDLNAVGEHIFDDYLNLLLVLGMTLQI